MSGDVRDSAVQILQSSVRAAGSGNKGLMSLMLSYGHFKMTTQPAQCLREDASRVKILEHRLSITGEHYLKGASDYKVICEWLITLAYNNDNAEPRITPAAEILNCLVRVVKS